MNGTTGNGGFYGFLKRLLEKHGPMAVMLAVACVALYMCVVVPFQAQQSLLTETNKALIDNTVKQSEKLTENVKEANETQKEQLSLLSAIRELSVSRNDQITEQVNNNKEMLEAQRKAIDALGGFSRNVDGVHDIQTKKLDEIIEYTKPKT